MSPDQQIAAYCNTIVSIFALSLSQAQKQMPDEDPETHRVAAAYATSAAIEHLGIPIPNRR